MSAGDDKPATEERESPAWGNTTKGIVASAILVLFGLVVWRFQFVITPLALAAVLAYLLNPPIRWLAAKTAISRAQAVLIVYVLILVLAGGASFVLGVAVIEQVARLWSSLPDLLPRLAAVAQERADSLSGVAWTFGPYQFSPGALLDLIDWQGLAGELRAVLQNFVGRGGSWLAGVATATLGTLSDTFFVLIISVYLAMDAPRVGAAISEIAHQPGYRKDADRLLQDTVRVWDAYLRGQVILGVVIFAVVAASLGVLGVNNALELGVLSGVLEFLPVIGPVIGAVAAVLVALLQNSNPWGLSPWAYALIVLGVMVIIQQIENGVLVPRIVGDALDLHPIAVMIAVLMGASLAGLLGAVLAAPVVASLKLYGAYVWRKMLDLPPFADEEPLAETGGGSSGGGSSGGGGSGGGGSGSGDWLNGLLGRAQRATGAPATDAPRKSTQMRPVSTRKGAKGRE